MKPKTDVMETKERSEILLAWALGQGLSKDPGRISVLYDEARSRWGHLTSRYGISQIIKATLRNLPTE